MKILMNKVASLAMLLPFVVSCADGGGIASRLMGQERTAAPIEVSVIPATIVPDQMTVPYVGVAEASKNSQITSPNAGRLEELKVRKGQVVRKGTELAYVTSAVVRSAYDMTKSTLDQAQDGYDRMIKVWKDGGVTELKKMEVETQLAQAKAAYNSAAEALDKCHIRAPYDGVIEDIYIEQGVEVNPLIPLMKLSNTHETLVSFPVPETEIAHIDVGEEVSLCIPAIEKEISGRIIVKGNIASTVSHTYECLVLPDENHPDFLPGMICKVYLQSDAEDLMVIPVSAVMIDNDGKYVWTVTDEGVVAKNRLSVSGFTAGGVIVTDGLDEGELVVTEGRRKISTGMKVKVNKN